jgi:hypothetical protein
LTAAVAAHIGESGPAESDDMLLLSTDFALAVRRRRDASAGSRPTLRKILIDNPLATYPA